MKKNGFKKFINFTTADLFHRGKKAKQVKSDNQLNHLELFVTAPFRALIYPILGLVALVVLGGAGLTFIIVSPLALFTGVKNFTKLLGLGIASTTIGIVGCMVELVAGPCTLIAMPYNGYIAYKHRHNKKIDGKANVLDSVVDSDSSNSYDPMLDALLESHLNDKSIHKKAFDSHKNLKPTSKPSTTNNIKSLFKPLPYNSAHQDNNASQLRNT